MASIFCVWLQLGRDFRDKSRMYYAHVKIKSRLVLRLLEYSIYWKCLWCPGVGIQQGVSLMEVNFFSRFVCLFFFCGGGGGVGGGGGSPWDDFWTGGGG